MFFGFKRVKQDVFGVFGKLQNPKPAERCIQYIYLMRALIVWLLCMVMGLTLTGQSGPVSSKYWVFFKSRDARVMDLPPALGPEAIQRRVRQNIPFQASDFQVGTDRIAAVFDLGSSPGQVSRWLNAVSVWLDAQQVEAVSSLPFVSNVQPIKTYLKDMDAAPSPGARNGYLPGETKAQLEMVGLHRLHQNGLNGRGVRIAVMDNGFARANENPVLKHLFDDNRILATYDFVNSETDVFDGGTHGQSVLSILAGWKEDDDFTYYGSAHGATFILCHTENDASETTTEEDNWVRAMEWADSLGASVFSTSLSYRDFDDGSDYGYMGMDGNTAIITRASDIAASKGILVVNSAGNSGNGKIYAPADGDSVIAVGAVDSTKRIAGFSSRGPTYDQRIKPDVCAMGVATAYVPNSGIFSRGNGTSFSCPIVSGLLACLLQAKPAASNMEVYQAMIQSADRYDSPDTVYGFGIPDASTAFSILTGAALQPVLSDAGLTWDENGWVYPNPFQDHLNVAVDNGPAWYPARLELVDIQGRRVWSQSLEVHPFFNLLQFSSGGGGWPQQGGLFVLRMLNTDSGSLVFQTKVIFTPNP